MNVICYLLFDFGLKESFNMSFVKRRISSFGKSYSEGNLEEYKLDLTENDDSQKDTPSTEKERTFSDVEHDIIIVGKNDSSEDD